MAPEAKLMVSPGLEPRHGAGGKAHGVAKGQWGKDRLEIVKAVRAFARDVEAKVELAGGY